jgi:hypothetical protein
MEWIRLCNKNVIQKEAREMKKRSGKRTFVGEEGYGR